MYRVRQFWHTITAKTDLVELERALTLLNPGQKALFIQLQTGEKNHAIRMQRMLSDRGEDQPDLLAAALLHDVGKLRYRLNPFERAMVVIVEAVMPGLAHRWGSLPVTGWVGTAGWRKAFIVAEQHAAWGAEMAHDAGASQLTETLIRTHQQPRSDDLGDRENELLEALWVADNEN